MAAVAAIGMASQNLTRSAQRRGSGAAPDHRESREGSDVNVCGGGGVATVGNLSPGLHAQSIGGGGGHGGATVSGSGVSVVTADVPISGAGGQDGQAGGVGIDWNDAIAASGDNAAGVLAQSVAGGGGSSGLTVSLTASAPVSAQVAVGGVGGSGGDGGKVAVTTTGAVATTGDVSAGVQAQSVGGGGGHSGATVAATGNSEFTANVPVGGGDGGDADDVEVAVASVATQGLRWRR